MLLLFFLLKTATVAEDKFNLRKSLKIKFDRVCTHQSAIRGPFYWTVFAKRGTPDTGLLKHLLIDNNMHSP